MADELIDPDTMARLSAMMRRAPMDQSSAAGMVPSRGLPPNPYNTEFPDHIGRPPMPGVYNERFSDLVGSPPMRDPASGLPLEAIERYPHLGVRPAHVPEGGDYYGPGPTRAEMSQILGGLGSGPIGSTPDTAAHRSINAGLNDYPFRDTGWSVPPAMAEEGGSPRSYAVEASRPRREYEASMDREGGPQYKSLPVPSRVADQGRDARVEQLMRELEEQQALEARLRALGR